MQQALEYSDDLGIPFVGATRTAAGNAVSLAFGGIVQAKVTPWQEGTGEQVLVGIRSTLSPQDWWSVRPGDVGLRRTGAGRGLGVFYFIPTPADEARAEHVAGEVFQMIADRANA